MRYYCTLFDGNYTPNFLALYDSLVSHSGSFKIYAFCMDDKSYDYLLDDPLNSEGKIVVISIAQLKEHFPQLEGLVKQRSVVEFYFSCSPFITTYVFDKEQSATHVTYLDADLLFFDSPEHIFEEIAECSVGIIAHKFYGWGERYLKYGKYNVGWVTFKNDTNGRACLKSWLDDCEEWCYDYYDEIGQRFGDQKYLDKWGHDFSGIKVISQKGANVAPWNAGRYKVSTNAEGKIYIDEDPLVFYHYASFKKVDANTYTTSMSKYMARPGHILKRDIYQKYLNIVAENSDQINKKLKNKDAEALKKNRSLSNQTNFRKRITLAFTSLTRWYFNDYIYR
jgi:hypothetical protein